MRTRLLALTLLAILAACPTAQATERRLIPFQGRLTDEAGAPRTGTFDITFTIYDAATGPQALWSETHQSVSVNGGLINVLLGKITNLDDPNPSLTTDQPIRFSDANGPLFLGIKVGTGQEMVPRHQLVPAFHARTADQAVSLSAGARLLDVNFEDNAVSSRAIKNGDITGVDIADNAIGAAKLDAATRAKLDVVGSTPLVLTAKMESPQPDVRISSTTRHAGAGLHTDPAVPVETHDLHYAVQLSSTGTEIRVPCESGQAPSGLDCNAVGKKETIGIDFLPPRPGFYEVCMQATFEREVKNGIPWGTGNERQAHVLQLVRTDRTSYNALWRGPVVVNEVQVNAQWNLDQRLTDRQTLGTCAIFHLSQNPPVDVTIRLFYRFKCDACGDDPNGSVRTAIYEPGHVTVKEIR